MFKNPYKKDNKGVAGDPSPAAHSA